MPVQAPKPDVTRSDITYLKSRFQKPALTSFFQCWFYPTEKSKQWISDKGLTFNDYQENISFLCRDASLPGSNFATNEITSDFTGVTERLPYRRQFDERADFTFYVDHYGTKDSTGNSGKSHNIIWFFENWMQHIVHESDSAVGGKPSSLDKNYFYRVSFPKDYQTDIFINKFERDYTGTYLEYRFHQAYPIAMASMPVSYDSSQLLQCTVSFSFTRYTVKRISYKIDDMIKNDQVLNDTLSLIDPAKYPPDSQQSPTASAFVNSTSGFLSY